MYVWCGREIHKSALMGPDEVPIIEFDPIAFFPSVHIKGKQQLEARLPGPP